MIDNSLLLFTMVNTVNFIERLQKIITFYSLSAASFADKIGVQRSSISHILSGRNKPSLEFIMKILTSFPEVDLYWLLNGKGSFPSKKEISPNKSQKIDVLDKSSILAKSSSDIEHIIVLYKDGSFKNYEN